jgi:hypothetical protein
LSTTCLTPCPLLLWSVGKSSAATEAYPTRQRECSCLLHCYACLSFLSRSPLSYTEYGGIAELLESLPRGAACANDAQQRFDIDATTSAAGILQVGSSCAHLQSSSFSCSVHIHRVHLSPTLTAGARCRMVHCALEGLRPWPYRRSRSGRHQLAK